MLGIESVRAFLLLEGVVLLAIGVGVGSLDLAGATRSGSPPPFVGTASAASWPGTVPDPGQLPGEPSELVVKDFALLPGNDYPESPWFGEVLAVSSATGRLVDELAPSVETGGGIEPAFLGRDGTIIGFYGLGLGASGVGEIPASGKPRNEMLDLPCSTHTGLALSPDGNRLLWLVGPCNRLPDAAPVLREYSLSGKLLAVPSSDGALSPNSWGGPGGAYVAGYLPPKSTAVYETTFGPIGVARLRRNGTITSPIEIDAPRSGCLMNDPVFVPRSDELAAVEDCDLHVDHGGIYWMTSTEILAVDPRTGRTTGVIAKLPSGLWIGGLAFDSSGRWITFNATTADAKATDEGVFVLHDGKCWRVPHSVGLGDVLWW